MYLEKSQLLGARRKRLWEDHERDEADKLDSLYKHFMKNFDPLLWPCPTPGRYDLIKFDSTLYQEAFW